MGGVLRCGKVGVGSALHSETLAFQLVKGRHTIVGEGYTLQARTHPAAELGVRVGGACITGVTTVTIEIGYQAQLKRP